LWKRGKYFTTFHKDLISAMSTKLEAAVKAEVGVDDGREMPDLPKVTWYMDSAVL
jgi:arylsulfatase